MSLRTITNPADNSALDSSVMRNELQILENQSGNGASPTFNNITATTIGVGTTTPSVGLEVVGTINVTSTAKYQLGDNNVHIVRATDDMQFRVGSSADLRLTIFASGGTVKAENAIQIGSDLSTNTAALRVNGVIALGGGNRDITNVGNNSLTFGTNNTARVTITAAGSTVVGAVVATNATDGFLYVPTCAGTPTGTPATQTGTSPVVVDTTNHKMYFYDNGGWIALN